MKPSDPCVSPPVVWFLVPSQGRLILVRIDDFTPPYTSVNWERGILLNALGFKIQSEPGLGGQSGFASAAHLPSQRWCIRGPIDVTDHEPDCLIFQTPSVSFRAGAHWLGPNRSVALNMAFSDPPGSPRPRAPTWPKMASTQRPPPGMETIRGLRMRHLSRFYKIATTAHSSSSSYHHYLHDLRTHSPARRHTAGNTEMSTQSKCCDHVVLGRLSEGEQAWREEIGRVNHADVLLYRSDIPRSGEPLCPPDRSPNRW